MRASKPRMVMQHCHAGARLAPVAEYRVLRRHVVQTQEERQSRSPDHVLRDNVLGMGV
jgi:hypothetical protein